MFVNLAIYIRNSRHSHCSEKLMCLLGASSSSSPRNQLEESILAGLERASSSSSSSSSPSPELALARNLLGSYERGATGGPHLCSEDER